MGNNLQLKELLDEAVNLITTDQPLGGGTLNLKTAAVGDFIHLFADPDQEGDNLPGAFVGFREPIVDETDVISDAVRDFMFPVRVLYASTWDVGTEVMDEKLDRLGVIQGVFDGKTASWSMPSNHQMHWTAPGSIEVTPNEELTIRAVSSFIHVYCVAFTINVHSRVNIL